MRVTTLDIETTLSEPYDEIVSIPERGSGGGVNFRPEPKFAPLPLHVPEVIVWLNATDGGTLELKIYDRGADDEAVKLAELGKDLRESRRLVTFNGRGFDCPLLSLRAMKLGVDWSFWDGKRHRFGNYKKALYHYALQDQLGDFGAARAISLDRTAKLLGLAGKRDVCGGQVFELIEAGKRREVILYCCDDVIQTWLVYLAFCHSHLGAKGDQTQAAIDATMKFAREHEYLGELYK
jgi:predicted PolB exonuclease-like 3'-5' exonuclease